VPVLDEVSQNSQSVSEQLQDQKTKIKRVAAHYQTVDPHQKVAGSKKPFFSQVLAQLKKPDAGGGSLLDVGCGFGYFLQMASEKGWQTFGVEIAGEAVAAARRAVGEKRIHHGTLKSACYADGSFDALTLWDVLVFAPDPEKELMECFRILKPGGTIGLRVRNVAFQRWLYRCCVPVSPILPKLGVRNPYVFHPRNFSGKALSVLLKRIGFTGIQIRNSPLTKGDPYGTAALEGPVRALKELTQALSDITYRLSGGRWLAGPSLLVWAEKPCHE